MNFFTSRQIRPEGWMKKQLEIQAAGLSGSLHKVWGDIRDSAWIGGKREGWERVPYWLDGFIPLAFLLENDEMIDDARKYIDAILSFQQEDGWICPCKPEARRGYDTWAVLLISKVLTVWADCSGEEERTVSVLTRVMHNFYEHIRYNALHNWGRARWYEGLIAIKWLYDRTADKLLVKLARLLCAQGIDWASIIDGDILADCDSRWNYFSHVVNVAMMIKVDALMSDFSELDPDFFAERAYNYLKENYGTAYGHFNGDECLAPNSPIRGSELCSVVEAMFSYEMLFAKTGRGKWLDRLEMLAFNGLPATVSPDMWTHQYDQQVNQVQCAPMEHSIFGSNSADAHCFGLEPHYGCCTANFSQGFPKLALSAFCGDGDRITAGAIVPSSLTTEINGVTVRIRTVTEYPFRNRIVYEIKTDSPTEFEFGFRIPGFAKSASYKIAGEEFTAAPGDSIKLRRIWHDDTITLELVTEPRLEKRPDGMYCLYNGALLYSLPLKSLREMREYESNGVERKFPYCDWSIYPESKWNYAFADDEFEVEECEFVEPFSEENPPISIKASLREIEWEFDPNGHCAELPTLPVKPLGEAVTLRLVPYGCTTLRMTELPWV